MEGYKTFVQKTTGKVRTILLVKNELDAKDRSKDLPVPTVCVEIQGQKKKNLVITSVYRQWSTKSPEEDLLTLEDNIGTKQWNIILGDLNLDAERLEDPSYQHKKLGKVLVELCKRRSRYLTFTCIISE